MLVYTMHYGFIMFLLEKYGAKAHEMQDRSFVSECVLSGTTLGFVLQSPYKAICSIVHT